MSITHPVRVAAHRASAWLRSGAMRVAAWPFAYKLAAALLLVLALDEAAAWARPGGGSSFRGSSSGRSSGSSRSFSSGSSRSSGSSSSSSSGGGGSAVDLGDLFGLAWLLIRFCIRVPAVGVPLLIVGLVVLVAVARNAKNHQHMQGWASGHGRDEPEHDDEPPARKKLEELRSEDENFSVVLLEDFLYALYAEVHTARGAGQVDRFSPYLAPSVLASLRGAAPGEVRGIVIGAMRIEEAHLERDDGYVLLEVCFEANYEEGKPGQPGQAYYVDEVWSLRRKRDVLSRTPDKVRVFGCPSCGAPLEHTLAGQCRYCGQTTNTGQYDWLVTDIELRSREPRGPMLTGTVEEQGTDLPTVVDADAVPRMKALEAKDPAFQWQAFQLRVDLIFREFQAGWTGRDLTRMRPFMSDNLFQAQVYWIETYKRQGLRNVTERARITGIELSRATADRFFDAVTVRVRATGLDYTVSDEGKLVGGSKSKERAYTEYWTLIRGSARTGPTHTKPECPNCGAPLSINMAGHCAYCSVKVSSGEFDWVLSRIEQDEVYR